MLQTICILKCLGHVLSRNYNIMLSVLYSHVRVANLLPTLLFVLLSTCVNCRRMCALNR